MDQTTRYRQIIRQVLEQSAARFSQNNQVQILPVCDLQHDQYLLISLGWSNRRREHAIVFHAQLRNNHFLIEDDRTEDGLGNDLIAAGVAEEDIKLAWLSDQLATPELPLVA